MDDVITLIAETVTGYDGDGNEIVKRTERNLMCRIYGVTRNEFYAAATVDLRPEVTVLLSDFEDYEGEKIARWNDEIYDIIRTYRDAGSFHAGTGLALNGIELILQPKTGREEVDDSEYGS